MGLFQKACETYDNLKDLVGVEREGHETLAPVSHNITSADIDITINSEGEFIAASKIDGKEKIIIPVTEESSGRTNGACPHPLSDNLGYLSSLNKAKHEMYVKQLSEWCDSEYTHPKVEAVCNYVKNGNILNDLVISGIIELKHDGSLENKQDEKLMIRWRVIGLKSGNDGPCWNDIELHKKFYEYYKSVRKSDNGICMITGKTESLAKQHIKGVIPINGNAKLISSNDTKGFTYRGRFSEKWQANTIGYEATQKAHNMLKWLAADQGTKVYGGRTFICWNPHNKRVPSLTDSFLNIFEGTDTEQVFEPSEYGNVMRSALNGYKAQLPDNIGGVVIAAFDAAIPGRLSLTYYNELQSSDFLERLYDWDEKCCWINGRYGVQSPSLFKIVSCAFGTQHKDSKSTILKVDDRVLGQQMQRMVMCRIDKGRVPQDILKLLCNRVSFPQAVEHNVWEQMLFTACAVLRKYIIDIKKEECPMSLKEKMHDRSYQFGRLLAVIEKIEKDTYSKDEQRETNAMRYLSIYCRRPLSTAKMIEEQLNKAYFPRHNPAKRSFYRKLIGSIMEMIGEFPEEEWNMPLDEKYMMGYYLQRNELYKSNEKKEDEE